MLQQLMKCVVIVLVQLRIASDVFREGVRVALRNRPSARNLICVVWKTLLKSDFAILTDTNISSLARVL
jgi:hypothetical protein